MSKDTDLILDLAEPVSYERNLSIVDTIIGAISGRRRPTKGISRPALVRDAKAGHRALVTRLQRITKAGAHVVKHATMVHGDHLGIPSILVGASTRPVLLSKPLTPKQKKALDRFNKFAALAANKAQVVKKTLGTAIAHTAALRKLTGSIAGKHVTLKHKVVRMHGAFIGADPDPANPGFLLDGSPDPAFWGPDDPSVNETASTPITQPVPMDQAPRVVGDGIKYDGAKGWPKNQFGSKSYFDTKGEWGYVWGWDHFPSGVFVDTAKARWVCVGGHNSMSMNGLNWWDVLTQNPAAAEDTSRISGYSLGGQIPDGRSAGSPSGTFGPLIGAPGSDFDGLQWATEDKAWFWAKDRAPEWSLIEIKNEAALAQKEIDDAAKATEEAEKAAAAKVAADQEAQAAQLEFELSMKEAEAASEAGIEEKKIELEERRAATPQPGAYPDQGGTWAPPGGGYLPSQGDYGADYSQGFPSDAGYPSPGGDDRALADLMEAAQQEAAEGGATAPSEPFDPMADEGW